MPFKIQTVQTDNGSEFGIQFHWHLVDKGIRHIYIRPKRPRLNGKVERSGRIDEEEFYRMLKGVIINDMEILNER
ncbi:MAG: IS481 family transposase, partial [Candidatus Ratteibacteria bacterium]